MKLKRAEWIAIAVTAAFLLLVTGIRIGTHHRSVPVTVTTSQQIAETAAPVRTAEAAAESAPVNLNTATAEQLQELTGVGPVLAERIVEFRTENGPFERVEDITKVQGIAEKVFSDNAGRMTVD